MSSPLEVGRRLAFAQRPRRNRRSQAIRDLVSETSLSSADLILPLFVCEGRGSEIPIRSMPGQNRLSIDRMIDTCREAYDLGILAVALFPVLADKLKDDVASAAMDPDGLLPRAIMEIKKAVPDLVVISDVAMDPYSSDGHDGYLLDEEISNDQTLPILAQMALVQARAGADLVAPSDMMDGRVGHIRKALDGEGFESVGILSYAVKYASSFYGPFREALDSAPKLGDKKSYQMDPRNIREALREVALDCRQGADIVMVKPALPYLDVLAAVRATVSLPVVAYQVSGEYAMIKAAAQQGWIDGERVMEESLISIKRAGASAIFTYFALEMARRLTK